MYFAWTFFKVTGEQYAYSTNKRQTGIAEGTQLYSAIAVELTAKPTQ